MSSSPWLEVDAVEFMARRPRRPTIDLSPLVDVVFLLIIFFTVSTTFREGTGLPITLPSAGTATAAPAGPIEISIDPSGRIAIDGQVFASVEQARGRLEQLLSEAETRRVLLRGDTKVPYGTVVEILDLARSLKAGVTLGTRRDGRASPTEPERR
ncbi:MAG: biopolymer transporter ExbD [Acidobacteriota bacterium]|nr:MAG: biopolymer transporter ExbD [Acidobacteriota bacterium]